MQRVWISLEAKGLQYQYIEVDPYKKPQALLEVNPRGLVPGIRHADWGCGESTVLMEYVRITTRSLFRASSNQWHSWKTFALGYHFFLKATLNSKLLAGYGPITWVSLSH